MRACYLQIFLKTNAYDVSRILFILKLKCFYILSTIALKVTKIKGMNPALISHALLCTNQQKSPSSILALYGLTDLFTGAQYFLYICWKESGERCVYVVCINLKWKRNNWVADQLQKKERTAFLGPVFAGQGEGEGSFIIFTVKALTIIITCCWHQNKCLKQVTEPDASK